MADSRGNRRLRLLVRSVAYLLLGFLLIGVAGCLAIVIESRRPEPGANMVLMGLPMLAMPMLGIAILLGSVVSLLPSWFGSQERMVLLGCSLLCVMPLALLVVLG